MVVYWEEMEKKISLLKYHQGSHEDLDVTPEVQTSPYLENTNNSHVTENKISLASTIKLECKDQNHNLGENPGLKKELISEIIHTNENLPNYISGDAEKNIPTEYEKERITESFHEDKNIDIKSESDLLADMLIFFSQSPQTNTHLENTEIFKNVENITTSLQIKDKQDTDYFTIDSEAEINKEDVQLKDHFTIDSETEIDDETNQLADLLIAFSKFRVHSADEEEGHIIITDENLKNQKENNTSVEIMAVKQNEMKYDIETVTDTGEEIKVCIPKPQQFETKEEIKKNISVADFQEEKNVERCSSYWNHEVGLYLLNIFIDNNSSSGMLHPDNYLFNLVKKL